MREKRHIFANIDFVLVGIYLLLVFFGWINIYSSAYSEAHKSIFDFTQDYGRQFVWMSAAFFLAAIILIIDAKFFPAVSYVLYGLVVLLLIAVLIVGTEISGAKSWIRFGSFSLQPSELAKFATALVLAKYGSKLDFSLKKKKHFFVAMAFIFIPLLFILLQNDTGSALVFFSFSLVLFREGLSAIFLYLAFVVILLFVFTILFGKIYILITLGVILALLAVFFIKSPRFILVSAVAVVFSALFVLSIDYAFEKVLEPYQQNRINVLLGKKTDNLGIGYNIYQSKVAIGSGQFFGKGFLKGTQTKFKFVPEQSTDFIFCTVGEEWGFFGTAFVILLYLGLLFRLVYAAEKQRSAFGRIYGYSVASILFFHFTINIGMTIGLLPVIGIPLPFMSYGGSSLWAFTILLFIFIRQDANRWDIL